MEDLKDEYMDRAELAKFLGRDIRTLQRMHRARKLPPRVVIGNKIFYRKATVLGWLQAKEGMA